VTFVHIKTFPEVNHETLNCSRIKNNPFSGEQVGSGLCPSCHPTNSVKALKDTKIKSKLKVNSRQRVAPRCQLTGKSMNTGPVYHAACPH